MATALPACSPKMTNTVALATVNEIVAGLTDLKAHAEVAVKSGALVLVLGGDLRPNIGFSPPPAVTTNISIIL